VRTVSQGNIRLYRVPVYETETLQNIGLSVSLCREDIWNQR